MVQVALFLCGLVPRSPAATLFVDINCSNPAPPYADWSTAATNIQDAINASTDGDLILVSNGVYQAGSTILGDGTTNRLAVNLAVTVQSVNGSTVTRIDGGNMMRCAYVTNNAALIGFTLSNGNGGGGDGGGVFCASTNALVANCNLMNNSAQQSGGGADSGTLSNCVFSGNSVPIGSPYAFGGGGAAFSFLENCLLTANTVSNGYGYGTGAIYSTLNNCVISNNAYGNSALYESTADNCLIVGNYYEGASISTLNNCTVVGNGYVGVYECTVNNSIVYYNNATTVGIWQNAYQSSLNYCCVPGTTFASGGTNQVNVAPAFVDAFNGNYHLQIGSPCVDAGNNSSVSGGSDLDGNPRVFNGTVDIGAYESEYTNFAGIHFVSSAGTNSASPYTNWMTAARNIQDAIGVARPGEIVLVAAGNYTNGGTTVYGQATNRVAITNAITVLGLSDLVGTNMAGAEIVGDGHTRCVYVGSNAVLSGFIITNGNAMVGSDPVHELSGGGVWCESGGVVSNCLIIQNSASTSTGYGGGAYGGTLFASAIMDNNAKKGAGCCSNTLINCILENNPAPRLLQVPQFGGGAMGALLTNCSLVGNSASAGGGGAAFSTLENCRLTNNAALVGAGAYSSSLYDTVVFSNRNLYASGTAYGGGLAGCFGSNVMLAANTAEYGGGAYGGTLTNCTLLGNSASGSPAYGGGAYGDASFPITLNHCLITSNNANNFGGGGAGAFSTTTQFCTLNSCTLASNSATFGGGVLWALVNNSSIVSNSAGRYSSGGGAEGGLLNNCVLVGNSAGIGAGFDGSYNSQEFAAAVNCIFSNNVATASGGGANQVTLGNCVLTANLASSSGGGAAGSHLTGCKLEHNAVRLNASEGGGTYACTVADSILAYNVATNGGGDYGSILLNCTLAGNSALAGGGVYNSMPTNCIIYFNAGGDIFSSSTRYSPYYCCSPLATNGIGNIFVDPDFVDLVGGDFHLQPDSPCINSGQNADVTTATDFDGNPRLVGGTVDIGAYEYQTPASVISYAYLQQYGLPTDGSVDDADLDGTAFNVYQDWVAGLNPTNSASVLVMLPPISTNTASGVTITWESVNGIQYVLQRSTNLSMQAFSTVQNITGQSGVTGYTDTTATNSVPYFYRVLVQ